MKITFPHLGNTYIAMKAMLNDLGIETIVPPPMSKKTLEIGTSLSPEQICIPFKYNIGNYIEAIEKGADTICIVGGIGSCRFGYYADLAKEILKDNGYDIDFIVLHAPQSNIIELYKRFKKLTGTGNVLNIIKAVITALKVLKKVNIIEEFMLESRPYEKEKGNIDNIYKIMIKYIERSQNSKEIIKHLNRAYKAMKTVPLDKNRNCIKLGIVGEIYILIENYANLDIGKKLNELGCEVRKSLNTSEWLENVIFYKSIGRNKEQYLYDKALPYIKTEVGGHGRESIGSTINYAEQGFDGIVQVMPFTCMPEIVAMSILPQVQDDYNIPILSLIVDEMTGEAGYITRLEAFTEMVKRRKGNKENEKCLFGY